ncbi:hypothetical protein BC941DRAFT_516118 [Chlamydoabsidia padenii]|nr:hypothetical protein BC941DRAFT_516118 [Chlamydoabsidia padenii]
MTRSIRIPLCTFDFSTSSLKVVDYNSGVFSSGCNTKYRIKVQLAFFDNIIDHGLKTLTCHGWSMTYDRLQNTVGMANINISCNIEESCATMNAINNQPPSKYNTLVSPGLKNALE